MSNVKEKLGGGVGRLHGLDTMALMTLTRIEVHGDWRVEGRGCWSSGLVGSSWGGRMVLVMFLVMLQLVSPLGGGGWRVAMLGGVPGGEVMRRSLLVGLTQVSAMTHLDSLLHA